MTTTRFTLLVALLITYAHAQEPRANAFNDDAPPIYRGVVASSNASSDGAGDNNDDDGPNVEVNVGGPSAGSCAEEDDDDDEDDEGMDGGDDDFHGFRRLSGSSRRRLKGFIQCNIVLFSISVIIGGCFVLTCVCSCVCKCRKDCKESSEMHKSLREEAANRRHHAPEVTLEVPEIEMEDKGVKVTVPVKWGWTKPDKTKLKAKARQSGSAIVEHKAPEHGPHALPVPKDLP